MQESAYGRALLHCLIIEIRQRAKHRAAQVPFVRMPTAMNQAIKAGEHKRRILDGKMYAAGERDDDYTCD